jgi:hypothetical protein
MKENRNEQDDSLLEGTTREMPEDLSNGTLNVASCRPNYNNFFHFLRNITYD